MIEGIRGCGFRKVGGIYLIGEGIAVPCDMLPIELLPCPTCGFTIPFTRGIMGLHVGWMVHKAEEHHASPQTIPVSLGSCICPSTCPICNPELMGKKIFLMWVGQSYYTPESLIKEAHSLDPKTGEPRGVSKRIAAIPKDLTRSSWILLAHKKVPFYKEENGFRHYEQKTHRPAIFFAFKPSRIEKLIWKKDATPETLKQLEDQEIEAVIIPDGDPDHKP